LNEIDSWRIHFRPDHQPLTGRPHDNEVELLRTGRIYPGVYRPQIFSRLIPIGNNTPGTFAIAINQDGTLNSSSHPAKVGSVVKLFGSGMGLLDGMRGDGSVTKASSAYSAQSVTASSSGFTSLSVTSVVDAVGAVFGVVQISVQVASSLNPVVTLNVGGAQSDPVGIFVSGP